ncbi:helix-turn-helix transcriptional regulator [Pseudonocardia sp. CA-142604]|uniref:helix-turn-helix transcriptional regulator n=1 Tax=Pseudonocardia sp. CA-142604 TaxID=3240024 RepID=UPI003D8EB07D
MVVLHGRETELAALRQAFDQLVRGRGGVILIDGEAGIGKTSLLAAAAAEAREREIEILSGGGSPASRTVPLSVLLSALAPRAGAVFGSLRDCLAEHEPAQRLWLLWEITQLLEAEAIRRPVMIALDDLHWADESTLTMVAWVSKMLSSHRILWLLAFRRDEGGRSLAEWVTHVAGPGSSRMTLGPLASAAVAAIAADTLNGRPDTALLQLLDRVRGNPFMLVELLRGLAEESLVEKRDDVVALAGAILPRRFVGSIEDHLNRLPHEAHAVLEMASVLGRWFSLDELADMLDRPATDLMPVLRNAITAGLIVDESGRLSFRHDLVREAVRTMLPSSITTALQRRAVEVMVRHGAAPADVAPLVMELAAPGDPAAVELLVEASRSIGRSSPSVAVPLSRRALDLMPQGDPSRPRVVSETIDLLLRAAHLAEAQRLLVTHARELAATATEVRTRLDLGAATLPYTPVVSAEQARSCLRRRNLSPTLETEALALLSFSLELTDDRVEAMEAARHAVARATWVDVDADTRDLARQALAMQLIARGAFHEATAIVDDTVRPDGRTDLPSGSLNRASAWRALVLTCALRLDDALAVIDHGIKVATDEASPTHSRVWSMLRSRALFAAGRLGDAQAEAEALLEMAEIDGDDKVTGGYLEGVTAHVLGGVALHTGLAADLALARRLTLRLVESPVAPTRRLGRALRARLDDAADRPGACVVDVADIDPLASGMLPVGDPRSASDAPALVALLLRAERHSDAESVVHNVESVARSRPGFPFLRASALHARAVLDQRADLAVEAALLHEHDPRPLVRAAALEDAGRLSGLTDAQVAVAHLDRALTLYLRADAHRDAARVRKLLRTHGVRRSAGREQRSAWPELTTSESAVLRLVVEGATNREVATALFISPHTVNAHLRHIFGKLGINSRMELVRMAAERKRTN